MAKTTIKSSNPFVKVGGNMPSTTGNKSGGNRGNNSPKNNSTKK